MTSILYPNSLCRGLKCTKRIRSLSTELWHILAVYIMCSCDQIFDLFTPKMLKSWRHMPILKFIELGVFEIFNHKVQILLPRCWATSIIMATIFFPTRWEFVFMLASKYELNTTAHYRVIAIFTWIRYVRLWPWPLIFGTWSHVTCSIAVTRLVWIRHTVPELGLL